MGCQHNQWNEGLALSSILTYILQIIVVGISSLVGLGAEIQKTSILMGLLKYNEYEAANITYYVSVCSNALYFIFLFFSNQIDHVDIQAIQLFFPFIVILTDIGNYLNRMIYDQVVVFITLGLEIIWIFLLSIKYIQEKNYEKKLKKQELKIDDNLINFKEQSSSHLEQIRTYDIKDSKKKSLLLIVFSQLFLQFLLFFFRGGNSMQFFKFEYDGCIYWMITGAIYLIGGIISVFLYKKQAKEYLKHMEENPFFYEIRPLKQNQLLIFIGQISFFFCGITAVGAGLFLIPCCILLKRLRMSILKTIRTVIIVQFLIDLCVIPQTIQNYNPLQMNDQIFYLIIGSLSFFIIIIILHILFIKKQEQELNFILIIISLFAFDFILGAWQAIKFQSPVKGQPYFSISIDDCSIDCNYKIQQ